MLIEKKLRIIWVCMLVDLLANVAILLSSFFMMLSVVATIVHICMLFQLRHVSRHIRWALGLRITFFLTNFVFVSYILSVGMLLGLFFGMISILLFFLKGPSANSYDGIDNSLNGINWVLSFIYVMSSLLSVTAYYHFFWALDERIATHGYAYKPRRVRWCFYVLLLCTVISFVPSVPCRWTILQIGNGFCLILLYQYIKAVRCAEQEVTLLAEKPDEPIAALPTARADKPITALSAALAVAKAHEKKDKPQD